MRRDEAFDEIERRRHVSGFLTVADLLARDDLVVHDPFSVLISQGVRIGAGCVFYPNVIIECGDATVEVGRDNMFYPGVIVIAANEAKVSVGDGCVFGPGGIQVKAVAAGTVLSIGNGVRLANGADVTGSSTLGDGSQVLGAITAIDIGLGAGGSFSEPDPDKRGAVMKGRGRAVGIRLSQGEVINGNGDFAAAPVERQLAYHPRSDSAGYGPQGRARRR